MAITKVFIFAVKILVHMDNTVSFQEISGLETEAQQIEYKT